VREERTGDGQYHLLISFAVDIKIENKELSLFRTIATSYGTDQSSFVSADSPHNSTAASTLQRDQVTNELAYLKKKDKLIGGL